MPRSVSLPAQGAASEPTERALRRIWRMMLGPKAEPFDAGLLDMGIGARRLMRLLAAIETNTGVAISPTHALQLDSYDAIAWAVHTGDITDRSPLIMLRPGEGRPLYIVSGGGGFILELITLARLIEHEGPVWGLQLPGLDGLEAPLESIEAMAAYYVQHLIPRHRAGPYHLLGYSFGGLVALEMARLLERSGKPLGLVGLLESNLHESHWTGRAVVQYSAHRLKVHLKALLSMPLVPAFARGIKVLRSALGKAAARARPVRASEPPGAVEKSVFYVGGLPPHLQQVRDKSIAAFEAYDPAPLGCPVVLIKSMEGEPHFCDPVLTWRPRLPHMDVVTVPGAHRTMIRPPYAATLAAALSRCLKQADTRH